MFKQKQAKQMAFSALAVLATAAICYPLTQVIGYHSVALVLLLVVSILAMRQGLPAVLLAAILSALVWDFFFIPPKFTFTIGESEDVLLITMYFIVTLLNGVINYRLRELEQVRREKMDRERALELYNTLFNSLSHELRTPIAAVMGAADTLQEAESRLTPAQRQELLEEISAGALRLSEQVESLLSMSRIEAGVIQAKKEWCDVNDLIYGTLQRANGLLSGRPVKVAIQEDMPLVQLDFGLTEQVLENLLRNACLHTPAGAGIHIKAGIAADKQGHFEETETDGSLNLVNDPTSYRLVLEVIDHGQGVPAKEIPHIFDKFYRAGTPKSAGTGLGLFIARGFVEAQGGDISLRNIPGAGAGFTIEFPTEILNQKFHHG